MAKKGKKLLGGKHLIIISSIIALNAMGMSYAYWNDQLQIKTALSTGSIASAFSDEDYWINIVQDGSEKGNLPSWDDSKKGINESDLSDLDIEFDEKRQTMFITGKLEEGYHAFIHYGVVNDGTIPIKYVKNISSENENKKSQFEGLRMQEGLQVKVNQQSGILDPQDKLYSDNSNGNPGIQIQASNQSKEKSLLKKEEQTNPEGEKLKFEINLPFIQWTGDKSSYRGYEDED